MKNNEKTYSFLKSNGFKLIQKDTSAFFGDYNDTFSNGSFQLSFSSSKSIETVDIRSNLPSENWYDLALVKALLYDEKNLNNVTTIEEHRGFLQNGVTKKQGYSALGKIYSNAIKKDQSLADNKEFKSAIIRASAKIKGIIGGISRGINYTTLQEKFQHNGRTYRIDIEVLRGNNFKH